MSFLNLKVAAQDMKRKLNHQFKLYLEKVTANCDCSSIHSSVMSFVEHEVNFRKMSPRGFHFLYASNRHEHIKPFLIAYLFNWLLKKPSTLTLLLAVCHVFCGFGGVGAKLKRLIHLALIISPAFFVLFVHLKADVLPACKNCLLSLLCLPFTVSVNVMLTNSSPAKINNKTVKR